MGGAPQGAMRVALQIWQVVFVSQTLQVFCLAFRKKAQYVVVMSTMSFDIIQHFTISYTHKFNNKFNDNIEICNMLLGLSICINKI
jgi:hypothetical protein